eukprot:TRINITY_DN1429_c0_g1_i1.p1 TRINITY_DN1429_c0_g1~~TRINITY_DN1429_c0_g1_i1.p1  ORF type:complete len:806 (-),score=145.85 TRINITY_DN1429_c0_g1_i1:86-2503(-)
MAASSTPRSGEEALRRRHGGIPRSSKTAGASSASSSRKRAAPFIAYNKRVRRRLQPARRLAGAGAIVALLLIFVFGRFAISTFYAHSSTVACWWSSSSSDALGTVDMYDLPAAPPPHTVSDAHRTVEVSTHVHHASGRSLLQSSAASAANADADAIWHGGTGGASGLRSHSHGSGDPTGWGLRQDSADNVSTVLAAYGTCLGFLEVYTATPTREPTLTPGQSGDSLSFCDKIAREPTGFREDIFTLQERRDGALLLHIFALVYMFLGIAIVADAYFVPSLEVITEKLQVKDDVAGATFMAAGGSAPELATSVIGVFVAQNDVGFGTIVGSAIFNVLFVIGFCSWIATGLKLTWWPLARDCAYYMFTIIATTLVVLDSWVYWYESVIMLILYAGYVYVMKYNEELEAFVTDRVEQAEVEMETAEGLRKVSIEATEHWFFEIFVFCVIIVNVVTAFIPSDQYEHLGLFNWACAGAFVAESVLKMLVLPQFVFGYFKDPMNAFDFLLVVLVILELTVLSGGIVGAVTILRFLRILRAARLLRMLRVLHVERHDAATQWVEGDWLEEVPANQRRPSAAVTVVKVEDSDLDSDEDDDGDDEDDGPPHPLEVPRGTAERIHFFLMWPLATVIFLLIPHVKRDSILGIPGSRWYVLSFLMSVVFIGALSYVMVWMASIIGITCCIPSPVMGFTVLAAGTSVPDLLESIAVARRGLGDMAVSSSIGSNVFDLCMGLPLPWLLTTAVFNMTAVRVTSLSLVLSVLSLFIMVAATVAVIIIENWTMTKRMTITMMVFYCIFLVFMLLLEYGVISI